MSCARTSRAPGLTQKEALSNAPRAAQRSLHRAEGGRMRPRDLPGLTIGELQERLRAGEVSPREVLLALHERIETLDPQIDAYLSRDLDAALAQAETADVSLPLGGIPLAIKDAISVAGPTLHLRLENSAELPRALRRDRHPQAAGCWRDPVWQNEHGRIRDGFLDRKLER